MAKEHQSRRAPLWFAAGWVLVLALCGVVADPGPVSASTLNVQITDTNDDACEGDTLSRLLTNTYVYVQRASAGTPSRVSSGFRFPNIAIARGATILSATVSVYFPIGTYDDMYCTVHGHATDNAPNFSTEPNIISTASRPRTTANTGVISQTNWGIGWHNITVTTIVQEIVNRSGWASGNALALLMIAEIGGYSSAYIYDYSGDTSLAAKISITYANPGEMLPLIAYTDTAAVDTLRYSTYSTSWSAEATGPDTNDNNLTWHVAKTAPVGREHVVLAASYTNKTLYAFLYNGSTWSTKNLGRQHDGLPVLQRRIRACQRRPGDRGRHHDGEPDQVLGLERHFLGGGRQHVHFHHHRPGYQLGPDGHPARDQPGLAGRDGQRQRRGRAHLGRKRQHLGQREKARYGHNLRR